MFQKSLSILIAAVLVALAAIAVFAFFNNAGAAGILAQAQDLIQRKQYASAINLLDQNEGSLSVRQDPALKERFWRLRYGANSEIGNARGALLDVENLLQLTDSPDTELQLDHIRLRAQVGEGEHARELALDFLERHPGDSRGLELAGEACQTIYLPVVRNLRAEIQKDVGRALWNKALGSLLAYVYRPDGDVEVAQSIEQLRSIYAAEARLDAVWQPLSRQLRDLRARVQEGLDYFKASLEGGGRPVAAFRGFTLALDQSKRTDDLLAQCEIYRRLFDHKFLDEAGALAVWALVRSGLAAAAVATGERWQPSGRVQQLIDSDEVTTAVSDLLWARAFAIWRLRDRESLDRLMVDAQAMQRAGKAAPLMLLLVHASWHVFRDSYKDGEAHLRGVVDLALRSESTLGQPDLPAEFLPTYLKLLQRRGAPDAEVLTQLNAWQRARPFDIAPRRWIAEFQLQRGNTAAALAALDDAAQLQPSDDQIFALRVTAATAHLQASDQDGPALLAQCLRLRTLAPDVANPIALLLCAEAALEQKAHPVARECARLAVDFFPQARYPRLVEIRASLADDRPDDAARLARKLLNLLPPDQETTLLALQAYRAAGVPVQELLHTAIRSCGPVVDVQMELLRSALASAPSQAYVFAPVEPTDAQAPAELRILAAQALARGGRNATCGTLLDELAAEAELPARQQGELAAALGAWVEAAAVEGNDVPLEAACRSRLGRLAVRHESAAPPLLASATRLAAAHPRTAYALCTHALASAGPETRTGEARVFAGRLALRLGLLRLAEDHWTAALTFSDGQFVAEDLARLCFAQGRSDRALQVYALVENPTDAALAARCGRPEVAADVAAADLALDAADLLADCTLAALGEPSSTDWEDVDEPATQERLELLSLLRSPDLGRQARPLAQALATAKPTSKTNLLLLARALVTSGQHEQAVALHTAMLAAGAASPFLWHEVALAAVAASTSGGGYQPSPALANRLMTASSTGGIANSPRTIAYSLQLMAQRFEAGGHSELAEQVRLSMWETAGTTLPSRADVELIAKKSAPTLAWAVLDGALRESALRESALRESALRESAFGESALQQSALPESALQSSAQSDRPHLLLHLMMVADRLVRDKAPLAKTAYAEALRLADTEGPLGCIVHFLLAHGPQFPDLRPDATSRHQLLLGHLDLVARGRDPGPWLQRTLDAMVEQGVEAIATDLDAVLRQHPTALPLWRARAETMAHMQDAETGIGDLRRVLTHGKDPTEQLAFVALAAAERQLTAADVELLDSLPEDLLEGPKGILARGLVRLRLGQPDAAVPLLEQAAPRASGLQLYALALACLQSRAADGPARAAQLFTQLAVDFAKSPLARHASCFAKQLAQRQRDPKPPDPR
ncbi:MAG: hypothetical protein ABIP94_13355 [Planctomycetota bacterium]